MRCGCVYFFTLLKTSTVHNYQTFGWFVFARSGIDLVLLGKFQESNIDRYTCITVLWKVFNFLNAQTVLSSSEIIIVLIYEYCPKRRYFYDSFYRNTNNSALIQINCTMFLFAYQWMSSFVTFNNHEFNSFDKVHVYCPYLEILSITYIMRLMQ